MKLSTIDMLRAHLPTASLAAILIEVHVIIALFLLDVSEEVFATSMFRAGAAIAIVGVVFEIRCSASLIPPFARHLFTTTPNSAVRARGPFLFRQRVLHGCSLLPISGLTADRSISPTPGWRW